MGSQDLGNMPVGTLGSSATSGRFIYGERMACYLLEGVIG